MKSGIIILIISVIPLCSFGQQDPLQKILEYYQYNELDSALTLTDSLLYNSRTIYDQQVLAQLFEVRGHIYQKKQSFAYSLDNFLRARKELTKVNNPLALAEINLAIGNLFVAWEVPVKAIDYFSAARKVYDDLQDTVHLKEVLLLIGQNQERIKDYSAAIDTYKKILLFQGQLDLTESIPTLEKISRLYVKSGQHGQSLAYDLEILSIQESMEDARPTATTLNNIGYIYEHLNEKELALQYFIESHEVLKDINASDDFYIGDPTILMNIGLIYKSMDQLQEALNYFFEALKTREVRENPIEMAKIYNQIAFVYYEDGNLEKAKIFVETAINLANLYEDEETLLDSYKCLSDIYNQQGRLRQSLDYYKQFNALQAQLLKQKQEAQQQQIRRKEEVQKKEQEIKLLMVEQQIKDLALQELKLESRQRARDIELLQNEKELQRIRLQNQQSEKEKARAALKLTKSQLEAEKKDNEIAILQKDRFIQDLALRQKALEETEREKEIELLERNQAIQDLEIIRQRNLFYFSLGAVVLLLIILFLIYRSYQSNRKARQLLQYRNMEINKQKEEISRHHAKLESSYETVKLLGKIGSEITANLSVDGVQAVLYQHLQQLMPTENFGIGLLDHDGKALEFSHPIQKNKKTRSFSISLQENERLPIHCFKKKKEIIIHNITEDYKFYVKQCLPSLTGETANSIIYQPLEINKRAIGVITVQAYEKNAYSEYHLNILRNLATHVAIAIENAFAYKKIAEKSHVLEVALERLKSTQAQLVQAEKMASLGELTAGIAHEINNPINFVYAGVDGLKLSLEGLIEVLDKYDELGKLPELNQAQSLLNDIQHLKQSLYFDETKQHVFEVVNAIKEGAYRTSEIVNGLRNFSRLDEGDCKEADIHVGIENTLVLLIPKIKDKEIVLQKTFDHLIPEINCYPGQLNQVFMNLFSNAIEAVEHGGRITVETRNHDDNISIAVTDNGRGISGTDMDKIFQPFFTTKDLGKGTGLGLSISFGIIQKHEGTIEVKSTLGKGSTFIVRIPKTLS